MKFIKSLYYNRPIMLLYLIAVPILILYNLIPGNVDFDTAYYILAGDNLFDGKMNCLRTPIYPLILKLCALNGGSYRTILIIAIQDIVYLASIYAFYQLSSAIIQSQTISFFIALLYIILPIPGWCNMLLTESLSVSGCIFLTYFTILFIQKQSFALNVAICMQTLYLIFLRPTFTIFLAIIPVLWIYQFITTKKITYIYAFCICLIPLSCCIIYCENFKDAYGKFTITSSFECNTVYNLRRSNLWSRANIKDSKQDRLYKQIQAEKDESYQPIYKICEDDKKILLLDQLCTTIINQNRRSYLGYKTQLAVGCLDSHFTIGSYYRRDGLGKPFYAIASLLSFHLSFFYLILIISIILLLRYWRSHNKLPINITIIIAITSAQGFGIIVSASESQNRLLLPVLPLFFIILGYGCKLIIRKFQNNKAISNI